MELKYPMFRVMIQSLISSLKMVHYLHGGKTLKKLVYWGWVKVFIRRNGLSLIRLCFNIKWLIYQLVSIIVQQQMFILIYTLGVVVNLESWACKHVIKYSLQFKMIRQKHWSLDRCFVTKTIPRWSQVITCNKIISLISYSRWLFVYIWNTKILCLSKRYINLTLYRITSKIH